LKISNGDGENPKKSIKSSKSTMKSKKGVRHLFDTVFRGQLLRDGLGEKSQRRVTNAAASSRLGAPRQARIIFLTRVVVVYVMFRRSPAPTSERKQVPSFAKIRAIIPLYINITRINFLQP
jgi:hypothetical protein